ncbi:uncharacterized protein TNIN_203741 [Trichonephila inaurata madagascariensis]|uniref:Integrase catalytic domain-containing protein n=1 Tax=Trichonephila inaurata madagascariensis TaxID=2747483 RepID=A0A8X6XJK7_9ARAC|nr:uncharacterized protein TNIN_203741 [Trichonephila inaurata madagascariensis]
MTVWLKHTRRCWSNSSKTESKSKNSKIETFEFFKRNILRCVPMEKIRPYIPLDFQKRAFEAYQLSHPGIRATSKLVTDKYIWHNITNSRLEHALHVKNPQAHSAFERISVPNKRFNHLNVDIVGPLPTCQGYRYLLIIIDRFTRWIEAIPLQDLNCRNFCKSSNSTTTYYPQANGLIKQQHCSIKAAFRCYLPSLTWVVHLQNWCMAHL